MNVRIRGTYSPDAEMKSVRRTFPIIAINASVHYNNCGLTITIHGEKLSRLLDETIGLGSKYRREEVAEFIDQMRE